MLIITTMPSFLVALQVIDDVARVKFSCSTRPSSGSCIHEIGMGIDEHRASTVLPMRSTRVAPGGGATSPFSSYAQYGVHERGGSITAVADDQALAVEQEHHRPRPRRLSHSHACGRRQKSSPNPLAEYAPPEAAVVQL